MVNLVAGVTDGVREEPCYECAFKYKNMVLDMLTVDTWCLELNI